jgi:hypothetical protein
LAAERATPVAGGLHGGDFFFNDGHLTSHCLRIEGVTAKTALDRLKVDDIGAGGAFFLRIEKWHSGGSWSGRGRRSSCHGVVAADVAALG